MRGSNGVARVPAATFLVHRSVRAVNGVTILPPVRFGLRDVVEIIRIEQCPVGKWVGRFNTDIGFVDCSTLHIDATALKAMMMNQGTPTASTASAEGKEGRRSCMFSSLLARTVFGLSVWVV